MKNFITVGVMICSVHVFAAEREIRFYNSAENVPFSQQEITKFHYDALNSTYGEEEVNRRRSEIGQALDHNSSLFQNGECILGLLSSTNQGKPLIEGMVMALPDNRAPTIIQITAPIFADYGILLRKMLEQFPSALGIQIAVLKDSPLRQIFEKFVVDGRASAAELSSKAGSEQFKNNLVGYYMGRDDLASIIESLKSFLDEKRNS